MVYNQRQVLLKITRISALKDPTLIFPLALEVLFFHYISIGIPMQQIVKTKSFQFLYQKNILVSTIYSLRILQVEVISAHKCSQLKHSLAYKKICFKMLELSLSLMPHHIHAHLKALQKHMNIYCDTLELLPKMRFILSQWWIKYALWHAE